MKIRKLFVGMAGLAAAASLIGLGAGAAFTDSATATGSVQVGTFGIAVSSGSAGATVDSTGHNLTYQAPPITSSEPGIAVVNFTVKSTGTIPATITVTSKVVPAEGSTCKPAFPFSDAMGTPVSPTLSQGRAYTYHGGLAWSELSNCDLGSTVSIVYTITATA